MRIKQTFLGVVTSQIFNAILQFDDFRSKQVYTKRLFEGCHSRNCVTLKASLFGQSTINTNGFRVNGTRSSGYKLEEKQKHSNLHQFYTHTF